MTYQALQRVKVDMEVETIYPKFYFQESFNPKLCKDLGRTVRIVTLSKAKGLSRSFTSFRMTLRARFFAEFILNDSEVLRMRG